MRKDVYQDRARELCLAAGVDPESRIDRPGQRSMPAWCAYRDAARQEHVAREAAATAAEIAAHAPKPQEPRFQNSPLKVFGQHDENTLAQMKNCMAVGNVVAGVICADGHLGYAQPVGGVIAYEKQISISGVGFDIGCGNMAVRLDTRFERGGYRFDSYGAGHPFPSRSAHYIGAQQKGPARSLRRGQV